jgi:Protein of unknown function (DUF2711)
LLLEKSGILEIKTLKPLDLFDLALTEIMVTDENMDFAFMNVFDSFITILMTKDENIKDIINKMNMEAVICDNSTYINWYSEAYK